MTITILDNSKPEEVYYSAYDLNFVAGDSPVILDVNTVLSKNAGSGYIMNDGAGNFIVNLSQDGAAYGNDIYMKTDEKFSFTDLSVDSIKITWVADSAYRVFAS